MPNKLIHGDCIEIMRKLKSESVNLIVTDPPYLVKYKARDGRTIVNDDNDRWLYPAFAEMFRLLRPNSFCISFYGWHKVDLFMAAWRMVGFRPVGQFVFSKRYSSKDGFTKAHHESAYLLCKGQPQKPSEPPRSVLDWYYTRNRLHPTQKPVTTLRFLIGPYSQENDIVLDPFAGSASTAVAAKQLGRRYIAIEKDKYYFDIADRRLSTA